MYRTWAVRSYGNKMATNVKTSTLFIWRNLFHVIVLNNISKELFDKYGYSKMKRKLFEKDVRYF